MPVLPNQDDREVVALTSGIQWQNWLVAGVGTLLVTLLATAVGLLVSLQNKLDLETEMYNRPLMNSIQSLEQVTNANSVTLNTRPAIFFEPMLDIEKTILANQNNIMELLRQLQQGMGNIENKSENGDSETSQRLEDIYLLLQQHASGSDPIKLKRHSR